MNFFKNLFKTKRKEEIVPEHDPLQEEYEKDYDLKVAGLESVLGKMHNMVGHAIIPFSIGGNVDMYYFENHIPGTGFATMELLDPEGNGPKPNRLGTYELIAFTKLPYECGIKDKTPFDSIERRICGIFTAMGNYSVNAVLNPNETCELPMDDEENIYMIFDNYLPGGKEFKIGDRKHHLLLCMLIFKSEMEFSRANGGAELSDKLKSAGYYPYSDLNREPVV